MLYIIHVHIMQAKFITVTHTHIHVKKVIEMCSVLSFILQTINHSQVIKLKAHILLSSNMVVSGYVL